MSATAFEPFCDGCDVPTCELCGGNFGANKPVVSPDREAERIATTVADRCQFPRKPGDAPQRYAIIWQAARLGALEAMREQVTA